MRVAVQILGNVSLNQPPRPRPGCLYFPQGGMAASVWPESVRVIVKLWLVIRFQNGADDFLQQFVFPRGNPQRAELSVFLRNIHPSDWRPSIALMTKVVDETLDFRQ